MNIEEKYYDILRHYVNPNDCATVVRQLLNLHNVIVSDKTCPCGSGETSFHKEIGCKECA